MAYGSVLLFAFSVVLCAAVEFAPNDETLMNIIRTDEHIVVGSSSAIYRIRPNTLTVNERLPLTAPNRLLVADIGGTYDGNILTCDNSRCALIEIVNFANVSWLVEPSMPVIRTGVANAVGVFVRSLNGTSEIVYAETANGLVARRFARGGLLNVNFESTMPQNSLFSRSAERTEDDPTESLDYHAEFTHNGFIYFVSSPVEDEDFPTVVRFCQNDTGSVRFNSHFEIQLKCVGENGEIGVITAAAPVMGPPFAEPTLLMSMLYSAGEDEATVDICAYSLVEIDQMMENKFRVCINGTGVAGFTRDGLISTRQCTRIEPERQDDAQLCNLRGIRNLGLAVGNTFVKDAIISKTFPGNEHLTSLTAISVESSLFLFAGSSNSSLYQFHVASASSLTFIRSIVLNETSGTNVTDLLSSTDGEHVYAMTPNKLLMHRVDQCSSLTDCYSCVTSNDPICGWCALSGMCVRSSECQSVSDSGGVTRRVFVQNEFMCPSIEASTPSVIHIEQLQPHVLITLTTGNILNSTAADFSYQCVFTFLAEEQEVVFTSVASRQQAMNIFRCVTPAEDSIPAFLPMIDTVNAFVSLRPTETMIDIAVMGAPLGFTDCSVHTSCGSCISTGVGKCRWCPLSFTCISDLTSSLCPGLGGEENTISFNNTCQAILPHTNTTNYLVHSGNIYPTSPLIINSQQLQIFQGGQFFCRICETNSCAKVITTSTANFDSPSDTVLCNLNNLSIPLSLATPSMNLTLQVLFNDFVIDNPSNVKVTVYGCNYMGGNCAQCMSLDPKYGCNYCGQMFSEPGTCRFNNGSTPICSGEQLFTTLGQCDSPRIDDFTPKDGPTRGGTEISITGHNLGIIPEHIKTILIGGVECIMTSHRPGVGLNCTTGSMQANLVNDNITMELNFQPLTITIMSRDAFRYLAPSLDNPPAMPGRGPASGGTIITVRGGDLGIGSSRQVLIRQQSCQVINFTADSITCRTPASEAILNNLLEVRIDDWSLQSSGYDYLPDPTFEGISPLLSFVDGGTNYTVTGQNLDIVQEPRLIVYVSVPQNVAKRQAQGSQEVELLSDPCVITGQTTMQCVAPSLLGIEGLQQLPPESLMARIGLLMDGVTSLLNLNSSVTIYQSPTIKQFDTVMEFSEGNPIVLTITGSNFLFSSDEVSVVITPCLNPNAPCSCLVEEVANDSLSCEVRDPEDLQADQELTVTVRVGFFDASAGKIRIVTSPPLLIYLIPGFAGFIIVCVVIFIVLFAVFCRKAKQKDQRYDQLMMELERLESSVARECKLGFAELQTDLDELTGDVAGCRLPYRDLQTFFMSTLFPDHTTDHPVLRQVQAKAHQQLLMQRGIRDFSDLLNDRKVLLLFVQTLEEQRSFGIRDKSYVGSLLIVALHHKMDYCTDVLKKLLTLLIRKTVSNSIPKLLLRRTESIAEKMLTNWLSFCLQGYILEHAGQPMFMLYRAVKNQLEKGPVDVITGEARYSLSEQKLIRQKVDVNPICATVETEDGLRVPVKLLDCDTISQAKEKLLDSMHKAAPVSKRPKLTEVDLEFLKSPTETMVLRDEDHSTVVEGGWKRLNTLKHYWVQDGAVFRIKSRREFAPPGRVFDYPGSIISTHSPRQRALSEAEDGTRVWHLFKQIEIEDPKRSPFLNKKMVSEIYLPRMLSTKSILQNFVDELFNSLFSITHSPSSPTAVAFPQSPLAYVPMGYAPGADSVPMAVKYLFDFLDDAADDCKITDPDVMHTWKNNALALRFWVNMIKNPEFVFDINKSHTVDACLSVVAQAFIDGCSSADTRLNIDSPTSKLLYNKEVQAYKAKVKKFYADVKEMPRIPEDAMQYFLRQLSEYQVQQMQKTGGFVAEGAVNELLRYATRYAEPFLTNLRNAGLQQRAYQFEGVLKISHANSSTLL